MTDRRAKKVNFKRVEKAVGSEICSETNEASCFLIYGIWASSTQAIFVHKS